MLTEVKNTFRIYQNKNAESNKKEKQRSPCFKKNIWNQWLTVGETDDGRLTWKCVREERERELSRMGFS